MSFRDLDEFFDSSLRLPIKGKTYVIDSPDAETGLWCQRVYNVAVAAAHGADLDDDTAASLQLDDDEEKDLFTRLLGDTMGHMLDDGLPWSQVQHVGKTAFFWVAVGVEQAEAYWNAGGNPEASRPEPQDHKAPAPKARQGSRGGSTSRKAIVKGQVVTPGGNSSTTGS